MSLVSVLENPSYTFAYPEGFNIVDTLVLKKLVAYEDEVTGKQNIVIGATSNVQIEAAENVQMYINPEGSYDYFTTTFDNAVRTDTKILDISAPNIYTTKITTSNQFLEVKGGDSLSTTTISHTLLSTDTLGSNQFLSVPVGEEFHFNNHVNVGGALNVTDNVVVGRSLLVNDHLITYGNIFGSNLNLWRAFDPLVNQDNVDQVGYGFRVNGNHQLELVKYTKFADKTVAKRVCVFGQTRLTEAMTNDTGLEYTSLTDILGATNLPDMPDAFGSTVDLTKPIQTYWGTAPQGIFYASGYVGISNNNPEFPLDVNGAARFNGIITDIAVIQQTATTSDSRLKDVINTMSPSECLNSINNLKVTTYSFKDDVAKKPFVGFMADEVQQTMPNVITETRYKHLDDCKMIDYNQIVAQLVGAVQHLSDIVTDMQAR